MGCTSAPGSEAHLLPNVNLVNLWMLNDSLLKLDLTASSKTVGAAFPIFI
jgi:hypothetical protein